MEFSAENRGNIVGMVSNFIEGISIADALNQTECAGHITREMLSDFVRENYQNYAIVYKRNGEPKHKVKAEKPHITPVSIPSELSSYAKEIAAMPVLPDPDPVFTDFSKGISGERLYGDREKSVLVYSFKNTQNNRFKLSFYFPFGTLNEKKLELALGYLRYLGTDSLSANDLSLAEYAKALSFDFSVSENSACLSISGLQQNFKDALPLFCGLILHAQNDPEAYRGFAEACCKNLSDQKKDPSSIQNAAVARALYGSPDNYFTHRLSRDEILQTNPQELTDLIHELPSYLHDIVYYGPAESVLSDLQEGLAPLYANTDPVKSFPEAVHYTIVPPKENQIYLVNYPSASNATVMLLRPDEICNPPLLAFSALYNAYAQQSAMRELREKQGLGYVAS